MSSVPLAGSRGNPPAAMRGRGAAAGIMAQEVERRFALHDPQLQPAAFREAVEPLGRAERADHRAEGFRGEGFLQRPQQMLFLVGADHEQLAGGNPEIAQPVAIGRAVLLRIGSEGAEAKAPIGPCGGTSHRRYGKGKHRRLSPRIRAEQLMKSRSEKGAGVDAARSTAAYRGGWFLQAIEMENALSRHMMFSFCSYKEPHIATFVNRRVRPAETIDPDSTGTQNVMFDPLAP